MSTYNVHVCFDLILHVYIYYDTVVSIYFSLFAGILEYQGPVLMYYRIPMCI